MLLNLKLTIFMITSLLPSFVFAQVNKDDPDSAEAWAKEWQKTVVHNGPFPTIISAVLSEDGKTIKSLDTANSTVGSSYLLYRTFESYQWDSKLNKNQINSIEDFAKNLKPPNIVYCKCQGQNKIFLFEKDKGSYVEALSPPHFSKSKKSDVFTSESIFRYLGYDAVVLEKRGNLVLLGSSSSLFSDSMIQALAIANSEEKNYLTQKEKIGSGLLEIKSAFGPFAVFEIIMLGNGHQDLLLGTKILLQK